MAQLCERPGATATNRSSGPTAAGVDRRLLPPVPSCPSSFPPQQKTRPSTVTRHVCSPPVTMLMRGRVGGGALAGVGAGVTGDDVAGGFARGDATGVLGRGTGAGRLASSSTPTGASGAPFEG